jgi:hypothetical protein
MTPLSSRLHSAVRWLRWLLGSLTSNKALVVRPMRLPFEAGLAIQGKVSFATAHSQRKQSGHVYLRP